MFISIKTLKKALDKIVGFHMFYGTTFLVFKKGELPVGTTKSFAIDTEERKFLDQYYKPKRSSSWYYRPMRPTQRDRFWLNSRYAGSGSQSTRTRGKIAAALIHESNTKIWGWQKNYIDILAAQLPNNRKIPLFYLATWLYRERDWDSNTTAINIMETFIHEFYITEIEISVLFDDSVPSDIPIPFLQVDKLTWEDLEEVIISPPDAQPGEGGTLTYLSMQGTGPAEELEFIPAERLNLITGDNGLGKTFILECAWWALTGQWPSLPAYPRQGSSDEASITFKISGKSSRPEPCTISYNRRNQSWASPQQRPTIPGLLVYARVDSSFAVWDPERFNDNGNDGLPQSLLFSKDQVWEGLTEQFRGNFRSYSEGLLRDWIKWQANSKDPPFSTFARVLQRLSPQDMGRLEPGSPMRVPYDAREIPTLIHPYGVTPITYAAAGIRRIVAIAYFIVWAWTEHQQLSKDHNRNPQRRMVVLVDEMEAHLHPRWQRIILPALLDVSKDLSSDLEIQFIVATHSPLIMASVEPYFKPESDKLFHLELVHGNLFESNVFLEEIPFTRYGPVDNWLMSDVFELPSSRSVEAELAIAKAMDIQRQKDVTVEQVRSISEELKRLLAVDDEFWPLWTYFAEQKGVEV